MKTLTTDFQSHLDNEVTTLCNCWIVIRTDGEKLGFTDHDRVVDLDGIFCQPSSGFEASQMEESAGLTPNNHDVVGALMSDAITEEDILARRYDGARIRHFIVNWSTPDEHVLMQTYLFGEITREDGLFRAELKSLVSTLDRTCLRRFEKRCSADLGDTKCGVNLVAQYESTATITRIISPDSFEMSGIDEFETGWFTAGKAVFQTGANVDQKLEIVSHAKQDNAGLRVTISLWEKPLNPVQIGDQLRLTPGCDKLFSTCVSKFGNALNFRGFPHMPGSEYAMSYASNSDRMNGGPLVP